MQVIAITAMLVAPASWADDATATEDAGDPAVSQIPDLRDDELKLTVEKRNWVIVPIPVSNPTLDTGLVVGGAYFHKQTDEQKKVQPPSVTGAGGFKTSNESNAFAIAHQSYFSENKWRIGGIAGHGDIRLNLSAGAAGGAGPSFDWDVEGDFFGVNFARKIAGKWYAGITARYFDINQQFGIDAPSVQFNTDANTVAIGLGLSIEYDNRDRPFNSQTGSKFKFNILTNTESLGSDDSYKSYKASYASYHTIKPSLVLAWEVQGCQKSAEAPLWDACAVDLRGFAATDYLGKSSLSGQVELRWQFHRKWGIVAFTGSGYHKDAFSEYRERESIPSYGAGLRFMVLESQGINMRLDYGKSNDSDAVYLSVGESF